MPGAYEFLQSILRGAPAAISNSAGMAAMGPLAMLGGAPDDMQKNYWDNQWAGWQQDPSTFPVPGQPRPGQEPPLPPDVPLAAPPSAPYGGPMPQMQPQGGMAGNMSQGIQPIYPMDQAAGGPGAPEPLSPMDLMSDYIPQSPGPPRGMAGMYGNPMVDDMNSYQAQTDRMAKQIEESNRVGMWANIASGFLNDPGNFTGGMGNAFQAFAGREAARPGVEAFRTDRDDQYLKRLSEMAQIRKLFEPTAPSAANRKLDYALELGYSMMEDDPEMGMRTVADALGVDLDGPSTQYVKMGDVFGGTFDPRNQTITLVGKQPMHITDPALYEAYARIASKDVAFGQVPKAVQSQARWQQYADKVGEDLADLFTEDGRVDFSEYERVAFNVLTEIGNVPASQLEALTSDQEAMMEVLSSPQVQAMVREYLKGQ